MTLTPMALCFLTLLHFPSEHFFPWVTVFHSLLGDEELQESESCASVLLYPQD